jgi:hypothetical protein
MEDAKLLSSANPLAELALIEGMNHILKDAPKGRIRNMLTYTNPKLPLSTSFTAALSAFLQKNSVI